MAFCNHCGAQMQGDERFCVKCGADQTVKVGGAPVAAPVYTAPPPYAAPPAYTPPPYPQAPPGQPPIFLGAPPAQSKGHPVLWTLAVVAAVLFGLYEIGVHNQPTPTPQSQPQGQPGPQAQPGQPGGPGQGGANAQLVQLQSFTGQVGEVNGQVQISNGRWTNNSTVAIQSSTLECVQYSSNGNALTQQQTTLTGPSGPLQPQSSTTFNPFQVGTVVQGATRAQCRIVAVIPAG